MLDLEKPSGERNKKEEYQGEKISLMDSAYFMLWFYRMQHNVFFGRRNKDIDIGSFYK